LNRSTLPSAVLFIRPIRTRVRPSATGSFHSARFTPCRAGACAHTVATSNAHSSLSNIPRDRSLRVVHTRACSHMPLLIGESSSSIPRHGRPVVSDRWATASEQVCLNAHVDVTLTRICERLHSMQYYSSVLAWSRSDVVAHLAMKQVAAKR